MLCQLENEDKHCAYKICIENSINNKVEVITQTNALLYSLKDF